MLTDTEVSAALYGQGLMEVNTTSHASARSQLASVGDQHPRASLNAIVGLRPFNSNESLLFFGRGEQTVELLQPLHHARFLAVVGNSGCGKSSLIYAGLLPKLEQVFSSKTWRPMADRDDGNPVMEAAAQSGGGAAGGGCRCAESKAVESVR